MFFQLSSSVFYRKTWNRILEASFSMSREKGCDSNSNAFQLFLPLTVEAAEAAEDGGTTSTRPLRSLVEYLGLCFPRMWSFSVSLREYKYPQILHLNLTWKVRNDKCICHGGSTKRRGNVRAFHFAILLISIMSLQGGRAVPLLPSTSLELDG